jgi:glyceraldehyde-3-phosphate dehydrogenase/erythrose-4-phosphate dehydrogenase
MTLRIQETNAHLLKYDTMLGTLNADISADEQLHHR